MRQISTRELRKNMAGELDNLPFQITKQGKVVAMCTQPGANIPKSPDLSPELCTQPDNVYTNKVEQPEPMLHNDPTSNIQPGDKVARAGHPFLIAGEPLECPKGKHLHKLGYWCFSDGSRYKLRPDVVDRLKRYGEGKSLSKELQASGKMGSNAMVV